MFIERKEVISPFLSSQRCSACRSSHTRSPQGAEILIQYLNEGCVFCVVELCDNMGISRLGCKMSVAGGLPRIARRQEGDDWMRQGGNHRPGFLVVSIAPLYPSGSIAIGHSHLHEMLGSEETCKVTWHSKVIHISVHPIPKKIKQSPPRHPHPHHRSAPPSSRAPTEYTPSSTSPSPTTSTPP